MIIEDEFKKSNNEIIPLSSDTKLDIEETSKIFIKLICFI